MKSRKLFTKQAVLECQDVNNGQLRAEAATRHLLNHSTTLRPQKDQVMRWSSRPHLDFFGLEGWASLKGIQRRKTLDLPVFSEVI